MNVDDPGASIENLLQPNPSGTIPGRTDIFDINQTGDPALNPRRLCKRGSTTYGSWTF